METSQKEKLIKYTSIGIIVIIALILAYFFLLKPYLEKQNAIENSDIDDSKGKAKIYANELRTAINPSGNDWSLEFDGTDEDALYSIATKIKQDKVKFVDVASAYYSAYKDDLTIRLQKELDSDELTQFYNNMGYKG